LFCEEHGFTCEGCGCFTNCEYCCEAKDKIEEIAETLRVRIENLNRVKELNNSEILNQYRTKLKELKREREERKKSVQAQIDKLLNEDSENFKIQYKQIRKELKGLIRPLDETADKCEIECRKATKLRDSLQNNRRLADIIRGYEYYMKAEKIKVKEEKKNYAEYEGQVIALKGFQGELNEIESWLKDLTQSISDNNRVLYNIVNGGSEIAYCDIDTCKSHKYRLKLLKKIPLYCGVAASKGYIYIAGGTLDMIEYLDEVWSINVKTGIEDRLPKLIVPRSENTLVVTRNCIVCIGGRNGENFIEDIEIYNPLLDTNWKKAARLSPPRSFISAVNCEGYKVIYIFGGLGQVNDKLVPVSCFNVLDLKSLAVKDLVLNLPEYGKLRELYSAGMVCTSHRRNDNCNILIFGGIDESKKESKKVYSFKGSREGSDINFSMEELKELGCEDSFYGQIPIFTKANELHVISKKHVHIYNPNEGKTAELYDYLSL
jgi:hypothetical protein